jgi:site-specific DNA recombinase
LATSSLNKRIRDEAAKPALRVVLYLRVSSKRQMDTDSNVDPDGNSIDTQRKWCIEKARQMGAIVVGEYVEPGNSAQTIDKRPVFRQMMQRISEQRDADAVIIYMRSRAFRNYIDAANTEVALSKLSVKLVSSKEEFGDGAMGEAMKAITDVFNWLQVRMSGEDIKTKMANKARNGGTIGQAPVGYLNVTQVIEGRKINTVMLDPERAKYVVMAFELFATGKETYESICRKLTQAGLRMPRSGKPISTKKVGPLLRDRYYIGYVTYDGIEYPGRHEPLITEALFERAQHVLATHTEQHVRYRTHNHYLKGLVWCGRCKHRLIVQRAEGRHGGEYFYFYCRGRQQGLCDLPSIPVEVMEAAVVAHYGDVVTLPPDYLQVLRSGVDEAANAKYELSTALREQFTTRLDALDRKENYFLDLAAEEGWPKDKLRAKIDGIRVERREIEGTLERSDEQIERGRAVFDAALTLLEEPQRAYEQGNETVRAILNKAFFVRLYVDGGKVIEHDAQEPFGALNGGYRTYRLAHAWTGTQRLQEGRQLTPDSTKVSLPLTSEGHVWSKTSVVELRGFEPLTPTLPVWCATNCATAPHTLSSA